MNRRKLGNTDLELTTIGLGTWAMGGGDWAFGWGAQDDDEAVAALIKGVELGINWIDTAAVYGDGQSEVLVGRALRELGEDRPIVATKFGRIVQPDGSIKADISPGSIRDECEASLRRLGVEAIDLYQMHWPDPDDQIEAAWETMVALRDEGKVRHIGVSNFNVSQLRRLQAIHPVASLQPPYNMIVRGIESETLGFCAENGLGVVCYSPMCKGLLTGTFSPERAASLGSDDHRSRDPKFSQPQLGVHLELVDQLSAIAARNDRATAELSIAWTLRRPEVTSAIVGARRPGQITSTACAGDWDLSQAEIAEIDGLLETHKASLRELGAVDTGRI
jgi:aryl-alcohol dehydrogenase-like predicted oxidoreductase